MKLSKVFQAVAATAALGFGASASALPVTFDLAGGPESSVSITSLQTDCWFVSCGASVSLNPLLDSLSTTLSVGQEWTFDFFSIKFYGWGSGEGTLSASLGFDAPTGAPNYGGSASGWFVNLPFQISLGGLTWENQQPASFSLADGTSYEVSFSNLLGLTPGRDAVVSATIKLTGEPTASVPEPATLALFGLGLLGAGLSARRRRA